MPVDKDFDVAVVDKPSDPSVPITEDKVIVKVTPYTTVKDRNDNDVVIASGSLRVSVKDMKSEIAYHQEKIDRLTEILAEVDKLVVIVPTPIDPVDPVEPLKLKKVKKL